MDSGSNPDTGSTPVTGRVRCSAQAQNTTAHNKNHRKPRPHAGNFNGQRRVKNQHPLSSKHRWSKSDLRQAPAEIVFARLMELQRQLEEKQQQINQLIRRTSTGKSGGNTVQLRRGASLPSIGGKDHCQRQLVMLTPRKLVSSQNTRQAPTGGQNSTTVQGVQMKTTAGPDVSSKGKRTSRSPQVGRSGSQQSIATVASTSSTKGSVSGKPVKINTPPSKGGVPGRLSKTKAPPPPPPLPPIKEVPEEVIPPRKLPQYQGMSYAATVKSGPVCHNTTPVFDPALSVKSHERPPKSTLRAVRKQQATIVNEELYQHLREQTWMEPLDDTKLAKLSKRARQFFMDYDGL